MANTNRLWKGMFIGALTGGAICLLDKNTRNSVMESFRNTANQFTNMMKNPTLLAQQIQETTHNLRTTVETVSEDVSIIAEKVGEMRQITPQVAGIVKDTKEAFTKGNNPDGNSNQPPLFDGEGTDIQISMDANENSNQPSLMDGKSTKTQSDESLKLPALMDAASTDIQRSIH